MNIEAASRTLRFFFAEVSDTAALDAQVLLAHLVNKPRAWILGHPETNLSTQEALAIEESRHALERGAPLPYLIGHQEFYGLDFTITPDVLIPRPETELLVEKALDWLKHNPDHRLTADIGTGSGCIAIALAKNNSIIHVLATDISLAALRVARRNAQAHGVSNRIHFIQNNLLPPTCQPVDLICANLPYIPSRTLHTLPVYHSEPTIALDGGLDGLDLIRQILSDAPGRLSPGGLLLVEIEARHGKAACSLAQAAFPLAEIQVLPDLSGHNRLLTIYNLE